ncbi:hypothetical protein BASA81_002100 [Batrachochytrium salamandrivorans]|nr:hypothetical protein BASA81_002100 [Batrachochytrium salamandrivorans]
MELIWFGAMSALVVGASRVYFDGEYARWLFSLVVLVGAILAWRNVDSSANGGDEEDVEVMATSVVAVPVVAVVVDSNEIPVLFRELYKLHMEERPFEAVRELERLRQITPSPESLAGVSHPVLQAVLAKVDRQRAEIFRLTEMLEQESNWKFRMKHKSVDVFLSTMDSRDFKVVCECKSSDLFSIISLIYETDLYKFWVPGVNQSSRWRLSKLEQRVYLRLPVPLMKDREVLLMGYGDVNNGAVMIYVQSIDSKEVEQKLGVKPGGFRCDVVFAGFLIKPLANDTLNCWS